LKFFFNLFIYFFLQELYPVEDNMKHLKTSVGLLQHQMTEPEQRRLSQLFKALQHCPVQFASSPFCLSDYRNERSHACGHQEDISPPICDGQKELSLTCHQSQTVSQRFESCVRDGSVGAKICVIKPTDAAVLESAGVKRKNLDGGSDAYTENLVCTGSSQQCRLVEVENQPSSVNVKRICVERNDDCKNDGTDEAPESNRSKEGDKKRLCVREPMSECSAKDPHSNVHVQDSDDSCAKRLSMKETSFQPSCVNVWIPSPCSVEKYLALLAEDETLLSASSSPSSSSSSSLEQDISYVHDEKDYLCLPTDKEANGDDYTEHEQVSGRNKVSRENEEKDADDKQEESDVEGKGQSQGTTENDRQKNKCDRDKRKEKVGNENVSTVEQVLLQSVLHPDVINLVTQKLLESVASQL
jgi:hypothetical protein